MVSIFVYIRVNDICTEIERIIVSIDNIAVSGDLSVVIFISCEITALSDFIVNLFDSNKLIILFIDNSLDHGAVEVARLHTKH